MNSEDKQSLGLFAVFGAVMIVAIISVAVIDVQSDVEDSKRLEMGYEMHKVETCIYSTHTTEWVLAGNKGENK